MGCCYSTRRYEPTETCGIEALQGTSIDTMAVVIPKENFQCNNVSTRVVSFPELNICITKETNMDREKHRNLTMSKTLEGHSYGRFPKWRGYKMCNLCEKEVHKTTLHAQEHQVQKPIVEHKPLCKKCSVALGMNNNNKTPSNAKNVNQTALTRYLALVRLCRDVILPLFRKFPLIEQSF